MSTAARQRFLGAWSLVSYLEIDEAGSVNTPVGPTPIGSILYTQDGRMSAQIMTKQWAADRSQAANAYFVAYSGPFTVDENAAIVSHQIEVSAIPSWMSTVQHRAFKFTADGRLSLSSIAPVKTASGERLARLVWARY